MATFTLELLHFADQEAGSASVVDAPNLSAVLNALRAEDLGGDDVVDNTITLSSGDAFIPGLFFTASGPVFGAGGIADIQIQNELGVQAIALGNHEFDFGPRTLSELITGVDVTDDSDPEDGFVDTVPQPIGTIFGVDFGGTDFPYLSTNLDFSADPFLSPLEVAGGGAPLPNTVTSSVVLDVNGEAIAVVGATTPTLGSISSPGNDIGIAPGGFDASPTPEQLDALAAEIQAEVNTVLGANEGLDKVILLAHMQQLTIELALAERLQNVDIIVAGGSNAQLFDGDDIIRAGDEPSSAGDPAGVYPQVVENAGGTDTIVVNTDGSYQYVGRLVIDFDADGNIIADSYDETVSGAYATDAAGVAALGAEGLVDPEIQAIADAVGEQILETEGNVFGVSNVFLNRDSGATTTSADDIGGERTQETLLGNLTADANLDYAQSLDDAVLVSLKNGGGIRNDIGRTVVPAGGTEAVNLPNEAIFEADGNEVKPEGGISENDIRNTLSFNNDLVLLTLTREELVDVLEHGVSSSPETSGRFAQISGARIAFDDTREVGDRILSATIVDEATGAVLDTLVQDGEIVGDAGAFVRIVTLGFLARPRFDDEGNFTGGGDGYPFPNLNLDPEVGEVGDADVVARVDFGELEVEGERTGVATFENDGTEQDVFAEYLDANFPDAENAFDVAATGPGYDGRIQNVAFRTDAVIAPETAGLLSLSEIARFDSGSGSGGAEIVTQENGVAFVTNGEEDRVDAFDILTGESVGQIELAELDGFDGLTSVDVKNGVLAVAIVGDGAANGQVAFYDAETQALLGTVEVGNLPDAVKFSPDGTKVLVSNEGQPVSAESNPEGSVSIIDISAGVAAATVMTVDFAGLDAEALRADGVRVFDNPETEGEDFTPAEDFEPEFGAFSPDGSTAYVSLQENNAFAIIDVASGELVDIVSQGTVDFSLPGNEIDPSDRDSAILLRSIPVEGFRMADGIDTFEIDGETYLIAANEGDAREYTVDEEGDAFLGGEINDLGRGDDLTLDPTAFPNAAELQLDENIGRLEVSVIDGDTDGDGDTDEIFAFGGRSVSIYDADGALVYDSGALFAEIAAALNADEFQGNEGALEDRSDDAGVEPESVVTGVVGGRTFAFVGLERDSGIVVMDVSDPTAPVFVEYFNGSGDAGDEDQGDVSPEGLEFVSAEDSPNGEALLIVSYEESGTTVVYQLDDGEDVVIGGTVGADELVGSAFFDEINGGAGDDVLFGRGGDDVVRGGGDEDEVRGGDGDDVVAGGASDDVVIGARGDDIVRGGGGDDMLFGGFGEDVLRGGAGDDILVGGRDDDRLIGADGEDTFFFGADFGTDKVIDFEVGVDTLAFAMDGSFDALETRETSGGVTVVSIGDDAVRLIDIDLDSLSADDFVFNATLDDL